MRRLLLATVAVAAGALAVPAAPAGAIVGGTKAEAGEWPWQVVLLVDGDEWCGGSLVAPAVVLTAAHCTEDMEADDFEVLAGTVDIDDDGDAQHRDVEAIDQHEDYDDVELENDLSLLHLDEPFDLGPDVAVVDLADPETSERLTAEGDPAVVTGFGAENEDAEASSHVLLEADVPTLADARCTSLYAEDGDEIFGESQVCAGRDRGHVDACFGDSGGPLVVPLDDSRTRWVQVGIVSWGAGCGRRLRPTVYTQVSAFADWLGLRGVGPDAGASFDGGGARIPARGTEGKASRYPLTIDVDGVDGHLRFAAVRLLGLSADDPEDLDIWLVAPNGTVVTLLSDVGGTDAIDDATVLITDGADEAGDDGLDGEVAPTDREPDHERDGGSAPADLSTLEGIDPNGTWQLLVADDHRGGRGSLDGWSLQLG
jgi:hypothetical protein